MAKKRKKNKKKEITKSEKNENQTIITHDIEKKLKILVEKNIPTKTVNKIYQNDSEISKAWVKRQKIKPFTNFHPHKNIWLVEQTREGVNQLIKAVNSSKNFICLCSFLLEDEELINALLSANDRGIRVYILTTSNEFKKKLTDIDPDYKIERHNSHIKVLEKLAGRVLIRCADFFHAKFLLVDPLDDKNVTGYFSTANFTSTALTDRIELIKRLSIKQVKSMYNLFLHSFWNLATHEIFIPNRAETLDVNRGKKFNSGLEKISKDTIYTLPSSQKIQDYLIEFIKKIEDDICISTYGVDSNHKLIQQLIKHADKGYKVYIFTRTRPEQFEEISKINHSNIKIYGHEHLHAKFLIPLNKTSRSFLFSANFQKKGMDEGFETGIILNEEETQALKKTVLNWMESFDYEFNWNIKIKNMHNNMEFMNLNEDGKFYTGIIKEKPPIKTRDIIISDLREMKTETIIPKQIEFDNNNFNKTIFKTSEIQYKIIPPVIPKGAKIIRMEDSYCVFQKDSEFFIGVQKLDKINNTKTKDSKLNSKFMFFDKSLLKY